jgi:hypothetical protein
MKRINILITVAILLIVVLGICTIDDFLSLHDIKKDYVSKAALLHLEGIDTSKELPAWTNTELEWLSIKVSYVARFVSVVFSLVILFLMKRMIQKGLSLVGPITQSGK